MCMIIEGDRLYPLRYKQETQKTVEGDLTADMKDAADVKNDASQST